MTLGRLMKEAITYFEKRAKAAKNGAEIRNVLAQEMSIGANSASAIFHIEYAIDGDYTQSDKTPLLITVRAKGKGIEVSEITH